MSVTQRLRALGAYAHAAGRPSRIEIVIGGSAPRIATLSRATLRMGTFRPPAEPAPLVPAPHTLVLATLDEGVELRLVGLPLVPAYAPLWPLAIASATTVVRLDAAVPRLFDETCALLGIVPVEAEVLVPGFSEEDEEHVAQLVIGALTR